MTDGILRGSCTFDTRLSIGEHHSSEVPGKNSQRVFIHRAKVGVYKFDGDLLIVQKVRSLKDDSKGPLSNLFAHPIMHPDDIR